MIRYPSIYFQIIKSRLVDQESLTRIYDDLYEKAVQHGKEVSETVTEDDLLTDFTLDSDSAVMTSDEPTTTNDPFLFNLGQQLLKELESSHRLNHWQVSQLQKGRTRFHLGQYQIIDSLGGGGYGHVFLASAKEHPNNTAVSENRTRFKDDVAIKVLPADIVELEKVYKFLREIELNRSLSHDNLVQFIDSSEDANVNYIVYEYIDGGDVRKLINRYGKIQYQAAALIIVETARALDYLHSQGIIHRDVKPGNILLTKSGKVKLIDLGLSTFLSDDQYPFVRQMREWEQKQIIFQDSVQQESHKRKIAGTPDYLSPDQVRFPSLPSPLWDIYSLGCTFYFMLTGIVPFPAKNTQEKIQAQLYSEPPEPHVFDPNIPAEMSRIVMRMMAKEPENRFQSVRDVIRLLLPWLPKPIDGMQELIEDIQWQKRSGGDNAWDRIIQRGLAEDSSRMMFVTKNQKGGVRKGKNTGVKDQTPPQNRTGEQQTDLSGRGRKSRGTRTPDQTVIAPPVYHSSVRQPMKTTREFFGDNLSEPVFDMEKYSAWETRLNRLNYYLLRYVLGPLVILLILLFFLLLFR